MSTRWRAPDLTPEEAGALDAIEAIDWTNDDEAFRRRWAELANNPGWYEELKATWGQPQAVRGKGPRRAQPQSLALDGDR